MVLAVLDKFYQTVARSEHSGNAHGGSVAGIGSPSQHEDSRKAWLERGLGKGEGKRGGGEKPVEGYARWDQTVFEAGKGNTRAFVRERQ
jgi:hypothetical protein